MSYYSISFKTKPKYGYDNMITNKDTTEWISTKADRSVPSQ